MRTGQFVMKENARTMFPMGSESTTIRTVLCGMKAARVWANSMGSENSMMSKGTFNTPGNGEISRSMA